MNLLATILADFTDEDWQEVKDEIKNLMVEQFKNIWEENCMWDYEVAQNMISDQMNDFVSDIFREHFDEKDMTKLFMQEMMKQIQGVNE